MITHNMSRSPEYKAWQHMKDRCYKPTDKSFKNYGSRGIAIYKEWRDSFLAFYKYIGPRPSSEFTIERTNNSRGYVPGNIIWATRQTQANNSRRNHCITIDGVTKTIAQWAKAMNISPLTISNRLQNNWSPKKAVLHPIRPHREDTINVNGIIKTTTQWTRHVGISQNAITKRLLRGWSPENAVFQPVKS